MTPGDYLDRPMCRIICWIFKSPAFLLFYGLPTVLAGNSLAVMSPMLDVLKINLFSPRYDIMHLLIDIPLLSHTMPYLTYTMPFHLYYDI